MTGFDIMKIFADIISSVVKFGDDAYKNGYAIYAGIAAVVILILIMMQK